jgi:hypothetical protein
MTLYQHPHQTSFVSAPMRLMPACQVFFGHYLSGMPGSTGLDQSLFAGTDLRVKR